VGSTVEARVVDVFPGNREYTVRFADDGWAVVEYDGPPAVPGATVMLVVERLLEWTHRLVPRPAR